MPAQIQKIIERLGYTQNEAKVYLATLVLGEAHITDIAEKVKFPRTSTQFIMDKLHKGGLVTFYVQRRYKYWVAEKPERLLEEMRRKEEMLLEALPALSALKREGLRKRGQTNHTEDINFFRMFADASAQPMLITDENVEIQYANQAWEKQFGYSLEEVKGRNPRIFQSGKTPQEVYKRMWETLTAGNLFQSDEIVDKKKNGTVFTLLTTIFPVTRNGTLFYIQILDDITEKRRSEALHLSLIQKARENK